MDENETTTTATINGTDINPTSAVVVVAKKASIKSMTTGTAATQRRSPQPHTTNRRRQMTILHWSQLRHLLLHLITIFIYVYPIFCSSSRRSGRGYGEEAVLDELHIISTENHDINGPTTLATIFTNDYWGRPLTYPASHKSWRPMTVLSFRYLRGIVGIVSDLGMHRFINILTHATAADLVGKLAVQLLAVSSSSSSDYSSWEATTDGIAGNFGHQWWIFAITKICFALHPTHVEVVANAANRSHIISVLLSVYASSPTTPFVAFLIAVMVSLLSSETALFHIVPIAVTLLAISYLQLYHGRRPIRPQGSMIWQIFCLVMKPHILLRLLWLGVIAVTYYGGRLYYNTLSIPEGLIRPAENPFFTLTGYQRFYSYSMVFGIHIMKQYDLDYVGFSHEYGYNCVDPIDTWYNRRLVPATVIGLLHVLIGLILVLRQRRRRSISKGLILYVVTLSWTFTLFPITGIVKVGTFISDRIVVASTVPISILQAYAITSWLQIGIRDSRSSSKSKVIKSSWIDTKLSKRVQRKLCLLGVLLFLAWRRIHLRSLEWMSSVSLLESSLRTCPRFAKGHLETSKIYSGLYPAMLNLTQARWHLNQAEKIDPNYCDVHFQFALLEARQHRHIVFEQRLVNALQCGFTMGQAHPMWHQYWPNALDAQHNSPTVVAKNKKRYEKYMAILANAIENEGKREQQQEATQQRKSPFVFK